MSNRHRNFSMSIPSTGDYYNYFGFVRYLMVMFSIKPE